MNDSQPPAKRPRYDLTTTFDVVVGTGSSSQRFTVHSSVLTSRSEFLKAARKPEWLTDPTKPTNLENEDPEVFSRYLNCVYFGIEALHLADDAPKGRGDSDHVAAKEAGPDAFDCSEQEHAARHKRECEQSCEFLEYVNRCFHILVELYLLADRLQDLVTANLVMDELIRFGVSSKSVPDCKTASLAYESTVHGHPMRKVMRDNCVYETPSTFYMDMHVGGWPSELARDVMVECLRYRDYGLQPALDVIWDTEGGLIDKCRYHQHDEKHPRCVPKPDLPSIPPADPGTTSESTQ